jgi:hypothetical protein
MKCAGQRNCPSGFRGASSPAASIERIVDDGLGRDHFVVVFEPRCRKPSAIAFSLRLVQRELSVSAPFTILARTMAGSRVSRAFTRHQAPAVMPELDALDVGVAPSRSHFHHLICTIETPPGR